MKFYSEKLKRLFDTQKELEDAEHEKFLKEQLVKEKENKKASEKEEYKKRIENARLVLKECRERYQKAREEAARILEESNAQAEKVLDEAEEPLKQAKNNLQDYITDYTKKFGAYKVTYTGEEAEEKKDSIIDALLSLPRFFW